MSPELNPNLLRLTHELTASVETYRIAVAQTGGPRELRQSVGALAGLQHAGSDTKPESKKIHDALDILYGQGPAAALMVASECLCWSLHEKSSHGAGCLLAESDIFIDFLDELYGRFNKTPIRIRAWRGLLDAYFRHSLMGVNATIDKNWRMLRTFLLSTLPLLSDQVRFPPDWLLYLSESPEVLQESVSWRFISRLVDGLSMADVVRHTATVLKIPDSSWFWPALHVSVVDAAFEGDDQRVLATLGRILPLFDLNAAVREAGLLLILRRLLPRHDPVRGRSVRHLGVQGAACAVWGNPFLSKAGCWEAVDSDIREMVRNWIAAGAVMDFFSNLAADNTVDLRRLSFWSGYHHVMRYFHFIINPRAQFSVVSGDVDHKYAGHLSKMVGVGSGVSDALVFVIHDYVFVEFIAKGNACYVYHIDDLPFSLKPTLDLICDLKVGDMVVSGDGQGGQGGWSHHGGQQGDWEQKFAAALAGLGIYPDRPAAGAGGSSKDIEQILAKLCPATRPQKRARGVPGRSLLSEASLMSFLHQRNIAIKDERAQGGSLWIERRYFSLPDEVRTELRRFGFAYHDGRGWWKR